MKKYNIIYADPPWSYRNYNYKDAVRGVRRHYETQGQEWINSLRVAEVAADDSILFLWVTFPLLKEGIDTLEKWGFKYKTVGFNWVKRNKKKPSWFWGMGNWTRSNSEICLIGIRGKPKRLSASVHSVIDEPIEAHSKKPDIVRDKIVELCGDLPRIELFARQAAPGWDVFGNEVEGSISIGDSYDQVSRDYDKDRLY